MFHGAAEQDAEQKLFRFKPTMTDAASHPLPSFFFFLSCCCPSETESRPGLPTQEFFLYNVLLLLSSLPLWGLLLTTR